MDFDLSDEQRMLQDSVTRLLSGQCSFEQRQAHLAEPPGYSRALWARFAEMGLLGLPFAQEDGGFGGGPTDTLIVMTALGRSLAPGPYLASTVLAGGLLRDTGSDAQRAACLPAMAEGALTLALAHVEDAARFDLAHVDATASAAGGGWILSGAKRFVPWGDSADRLLVSARTHGRANDRDGLSLFLVDAAATGITRRGYRTQDHGRAADIRFDSVRVDADALIGVAGAALPAIERATDVATAALCAEAIGVMERAHELTVDYLKVRRQFGVAIGSFQALQHRAVDMLVALEQARSMALYAAMMCDDPDPDARSRAISAAKVQVGRSARFVGQEAVQLHGGIGMTEECQVGHYFRRLTLVEILFGDSAHHLRRLARSGGLVDA
ncbi:MAG: acyl-CoA dehydrogenase family protein [Burkholderiaceae bacterium]